MIIIMIVGSILALCAFCVDANVNLTRLLTFFRKGKGRYRRVCPQGGGICTLTENKDAL